MNPLFQSLPTSIFARMSALAAEHEAVNLGQGFPDFGWPEDVLEKAAEATLRGSNQYAPMTGLPALREAVADHYRLHQGLDVVPDGVIVTSGATEALASAIMAVVSPGDEVVMFQPLYDAYAPLVRRAGGVPRFVRLTPPDWAMSEAALSEAFTPKTRLVIFNNPHNPTARLYRREELQLLADFCIRNDAILLSDEVWEHLVFDGLQFVSMASIPGMAERTVKIGSAGKIFSLTGWKVGWIVAEPGLAAAISKAHQFLTFATAPNLQAAVAYGLGKEQAYFDGMRAAFQKARDDMAARLESAGYRVLPAEGTYFLSIDLEASGIGADDAHFCDRAVKECGVAAIPVSEFYDDDPVRSVIRLCFAKREETIAKGVEGLAKARRLFG